MGQVSAAGYFAAKQTATTACLTYNQQKEPALAAVAPADGVVPLVPQGFASPDVVAVPSSVATTATLPGAASITTTAQQTACERCVCN
jgi:NCAIR mutase (PurE)-related protein